MRVAGATPDLAAEALPSLLSLAATAVMQLPQTLRVRAVNVLAIANPSLADIILSVNKCGYGPITEFVQHLDLHSSDLSEEDGSDDQASDGKVTLSTVHGCKGLLSEAKALCMLAGVERMFL